MENLGTSNNQMQQGINNILLQAPLLFRNFSSEDLRDFLKIGQPLMFKKEDLIIDEVSSETDTAFLIVSGKVSVWKDEIHLASLSDGDFIGETFLFSKGGRTASVSAQEDTTLLKFKRSVVLDYFRSKPERLFKLFIMNIIEIQQRKISGMNVKLIQLQKRLLNKDSSE
jgi:CRP-like cAMP-binding protein